MARYFSPMGGVFIVCSHCGKTYIGLNEADPCPRCGNGWLKDSTMINRHVPVESANIKALGYDPESNVLEVIFTADVSEVYRYKNVTPLDFAQLLNAKSIGSHFAQTIRKDAKKWPWEKAKLPTRK